MRRALLLAVLAVPLTAPPAHAAEGDPAVGWWSRTRLGAPSPVEAPAPVPEGGMWVAGEPTGPLAVSALRAELPGDARAVRLVLPVADVRGTPAVEVCAAAARWEPVQGGRLDAAPAADCTTLHPAELADGVLVVALALPPGPVDVVLRPLAGSAFSLVLEPPTADAVVLAEPEAAPPVAPEPAPEASSGLPSLTAEALPALPGLTPLLDLAAPGAAPLLPDGLPVPPEPPARLLVLPQALPLPDDRRHAVPAAALLALLGVLATRLAAEPDRAPRALGGAARVRLAAVGTAPPSEPGAVRGVGRYRRERPELLRRRSRADRGVGRFRRDRTAPPVRL